MWQGWWKDFCGFDIFDFGIFISRSKVRKDARGILESWALESGIQLKEPGMPRTIGIPNISSPDKESEIQDPWRRIQNPWPSWITLRGAILLACVVRLRERFSRAKSDARELVSFRLSRKHCIRMLASSHFEAGIFRLCLHYTEEFSCLHEKLFGSVSTKTAHNLQNWNKPYTHTKTSIELYQMEWLADKALICCTKWKS